MNTFGHKFRFSTFGESHGKAIGCIIDGVPAGLTIDTEFIQQELNRRKPGQNQYATQRKEGDCVEVLSGTFEGKSTGTPIALIIVNENQKSKDYSNIKDLFRPGHADFTYWNKYEIRDYRGGGRSSARETAARVATGAIAKLLLLELGIELESGICSIGDIKGTQEDFKYALQSEIYSLDPHREKQQKEAILQAKKNHNSIGGIALIKAKNVPIGLGEPIYFKLDAQIANAMMGINAVKAVEIGDGIQVTSHDGFTNNDQMSKEKGFYSNHSGGILGGISTGSDIITKVHFKPTPSIFLEQDTINIEEENHLCKLKGRHDPCVAIRGSIVAESMLSIVLADMLLLNMSSTLSHVKKVYCNSK